MNGSEGHTFSASDSLVAPEEVFGAGSRLATSSVAPPPEAARPFSREGVFQGSVLLVALGYCLIICFFRGYVMNVVKLLRGRIYTEIILEEANHSFVVFLRIASALGLLAAAVALVRLAEWIDGPAIAAILPPWAVMLAVPLAMAGLAVVTGYRRLLLGIAGSVTLTGGFVHKLWYLRTMVMALGATFAIPLLLLAALNDGPSEAAVIRLLIGLLAATLGLLLYKTYRLFRMSGVSILHWFSYLCAVEIFPLSLVVGGILRSSY